MRLASVSLKDTVTLELGEAILHNVPRELVGSLVYTYNIKGKVPIYVVEEFREKEG